MTTQSFRLKRNEQKISLDELKQRWFESFFMIDEDFSDMSSYGWSKALEAQEANKTKKGEVYAGFDSAVDERRLIVKDGYVHGVELIRWAEAYDVEISQEPRLGGLPPYVQGWYEQLEDYKATIASASPKSPYGQCEKQGENDIQKEWIVKSIALADEIALKRWNNGEREITARNIAGAVAVELAKGEPGDPQKYHGNRGPREAGTIRTHALSGWKFKYPSGTNGTD